MPDFFSRLVDSSRFSALLLLFAVVACSPPSDSPSEQQLAQHADEVRQWRLKHDETLKQPDNWLSLVGLAWLDPGDSPVGSGEDSIVLLPASAPATVGVIRGSDEGWTFEAADGVTVRVADEDVTAAMLATDAEGEPTIVSSGSISFYLIDRQSRIGVRIKDSQSPGLREFTGIERFPVDWSWRVVANYVPHDPPKPFPVPTVLGTTLDQESPGMVEFERDGQTHQIDVLAAGDQVWLIYGDSTNGHETYGGGRFLYADLETGGPDQPGPIVVDFNYSYNPPCAFSPYATCPLPPPSNVLPIAIAAGDKDYGHH